MPPFSDIAEVEFVKAVEHGLFVGCGFPHQQIGRLLRVDAPDLSQVFGNIAFLRRCEIGKGPAQENKCPFEFVRGKGLQIVVELLP